MFASILKAVDGSLLCNSSVSIYSYYIYATAHHDIMNEQRSLLFTAFTGRAYDRSNDLHLHFMYTLTVYVQVWVSLKARIQKMEIKLEESHLFRAHLQNPKTAPTTLTGLYVYCRLISYS